MNKKLARLIALLCTVAVLGICPCLAEESDTSAPAHVTETEKRSEPKTEEKEEKKSEAKAEEKEEKKSEAKEEEKEEKSEPKSEEERSEKEVHSDPTEAPVPTERPVETEAPSETEAPVSTPEPAETEAPVDTPEPAETELPAETEEPLPEETPEPIMTLVPMITLAPESTVDVDIRIRDAHSAYAEGTRVHLMTELKGIAIGEVTYSWEMKRTCDGDWRTLSDETRNYLDIEMEEQYDGVQLRVIVTDTLEGIVLRSVASSAVELKLAVAATPEKPAPSFSVAIGIVDTPDHLYEGLELTIASELKGEVFSPEYQWQVLRGGAWEDISGETGSCYTFTVRAEDAGASYRVVVTDTVPAETEEAAAADDGESADETV